MPRSQTSQGIVRGGIARAGLATLAVVAALAGSSAAFAQSAEDIAAGRQLFLQKGNCQACHGWAADGRKMDSQMPDGANLREIPLDREVLIKTVKCGRPGTGMPAFDRLAYSDGRCFGLKLSDLRARGLRDARSAIDAGSQRGRAACRLPVRQGGRQGADQSCVVRRLLGLRC